MVDLDGAFDGAAKSRKIVRRICTELSIPVQLGGGIRDMETARAYLDAGVSRLIIGTLALEQPDLFAEMCRAFPGRIGVSLDADGGKLKTRGWVADTGLTVDGALPRLLADGAAFIIYTDIERDGMGRRPANFAGDAFFQLFGAAKASQYGLAGLRVLGVSLKLEVKAALQGHKAAAIAVFVGQIDQLALGYRLVARQGEIAVILHQTRHLR